MNESTGKSNDSGQTATENGEGTKRSGGFGALLKGGVTGIVATGFALVALNATFPPSDPVSQTTRAEPTPVVSEQPEPVVTESTAEALQPAAEPDPAPLEPVEDPKPEPLNESDGEELEIALVPPADQPDLSVPVQPAPVEVEATVPEPEQSPATVLEEAENTPPVEPEIAEPSPEPIEIEEIAPPIDSNETDTGPQQTETVEAPQDVEPVQETVNEQSEPVEEEKVETGGLEQPDVPEPEISEPVQAVEAPVSEDVSEPEPVEDANEQDETEVAVVSEPAETPQAAPAGPAWQVNAVPFDETGDIPLIALILEQPQKDPVPTEQIFALNLPLNLAIVPSDGNVADLGAAAREAGYEVIAHLPMEPRGTANPGPEALTVDMTDQQAIARTVEFINRLPVAVAASNFMGSKATEDEELMRAIIGALDERGLAFVDSRTSPRSKGFRVAEELGALRARNSRFIPSEVTPDQAYRLLERAAGEARQRGGTVVIGPASRGMLLGVQRWALERNGKRARLAPISAIIRSGGGR